MTKSMLHVWLLSAASLTLLPSVTHAASFYIQEQSVSGMATAFAGAGGQGAFITMGSNRGLMQIMRCSALSTN